MQAIYSDEFRQMTGNYGVKFENHCAAAGDCDGAAGVEKSRAVPRVNGEIWQYIGNWRVVTGPAWRARED